MPACLEAAIRIRRLAPVAAVFVGAGLILVGPVSWAAGPNKNRFRAATQSLKPIAPPPPRSALLTTEAWQSAPLTPLAPGELDALIAREQERSKITPAPLSTDEQFIRRATLDLTGQLPLPADVDEFAANPDPDKRARLIDRLLESDEYARHWARYWREVVTARLTAAPRLAILAQGFEEWLYEQLRANRSWADIARAMLTASGEVRFEELEKNGAAFFLAAHRGTDADNERAAETSRIFLGIQIQCAQCHDHPSDQWKRVQFHELAGYFARLRERPIRDGKQLVGVELIGAPRGEHEMPGKEDPKKGLVTYPRFLDGRGPSPAAGDLDRRKFLARQIISKDNYWFAGAYVNRIWGVLMGQSFYEPVDDMGPQKEAVFPSVLTRLTGSFRGSNYDVKRLFRDIMNSQAYQRQIRLNGSSEQHLHFAAAYPTRLPADALWESLVGVLGRLTAGPANLARRRPFAAGLEGVFKQEFSADPSSKADEVQGSIAQALLLMNNPTISQRLQARGTNLLGRILKAYPSDDDALRILYLRTLARRPTDRELERCRQHLRESATRAEGFEDVLWALLNSTEFQTKR